MTIGDYVASLLRTAVPGLWAALITWLVGRADWLPQPVVDWLNSPTAVGFVAAAVLVAWYALWRRAEPHIPDWLTRLVLGSAKAPTYDAVLKAVKGPGGVYYVAGPESTLPAGTMVTRRETVGELTQER